MPTKQKAHPENMEHLQQYLLGFDGLGGGEDVRVMLPLEDPVQDFQLLLGEEVSSHLLPKEVSAWQGVAIRYWGLLKTFQRGEKKAEDQQALQ